MNDLKKKLVERKEQEKLIKAYFELGEKEVKNAMELNEERRVLDQLLEQLLVMFQKGRIDEDLIEEGLRKYPSNSGIGIVLKAIDEEEIEAFIPPEDFESAMEYIKIL